MKPNYDNPLSNFAFKCKQRPCNEVISRVSIKRTLNDRVWSDRSGYLKAVVEPLEVGPTAPAQDFIIRQK